MLKAGVPIFYGAFQNWSVFFTVYSNFYFSQVSKPRRFTEKRRRTVRIHKGFFEQNVEMLLANKIQPTALANGLVPVDIDVTPMDNSKSKKEGVSRTYKGIDGYTPMMAYIGTEGYAINFELREGKQHCQKGTVKFLQETITLCTI